MSDLKQVHAVHDKATLVLLQRAYNDFCRHAGIHAKPSTRDRISQRSSALKLIVQSSVPRSTRRATLGD